MAIWDIDSCTQVMGMGETRWQDTMEITQDKYCEKEYTVLKYISMSNLIRSKACHEALQELDELKLSEGGGSITSVNIIAILKKKRRGDWLHWLVTAGYIEEKKEERIPQRGEVWRFDREAAGEKPFEVIRIWGRDSNVVELCNIGGDTWSITTDNIKNFKLSYVGKLGAFTKIWD